MAVIVRPVYRPMTGGGNLDPGLEGSFQLDPVLLRTAVEVAHKSLRRMKERDVPPKLRDVAARSGKLPVPLVRRLLTELDSSEWLRAEAVEELGPEGDHAASLFLRRPQGWQDQLRALTARGSSAAEASKAARLETELRRTVEKARKLSESLDRAKQREEDIAAVHRERLAAEAAKKQRALAAQERVIERLKKEGADLKGKVSALQAENAALTERMKTLRTVQKKRNPTAGRTQTSFDGWAPQSPLALARRLDDVMTAAALPATSTTAKPRSSQSAGVRLPSSIRPDKPEAIKWLLAQPDALVVAIDGWNAAHQLKSPPDATQRDRVVEAARRVAIASKGRRTMLVFFDSVEGSESYSTKELEVRFVPSADEEIIAFAQRNAKTPVKNESSGARSGPRIGLVVITSDRRVREAVEANGAIGLWSEALIDWLKTSGRRSFGP